MMNRSFMFAQIYAKGYGNPVEIKEYTLTDEQRKGLTVSKEAFEAAIAPAARKPTSKWLRWLIWT